MPRVPLDSPRRGARCAAYLLPVCAALALHLPFLEAPFGPGCNNAGTYYAVFSQLWERHGFFEMRGLPVHALALEPPENGESYLNHPPLSFWLTAFSPAPWALRLPSMLAHLGLILMVVGWSRRVLGGVLAPAMTGLAIACTPILGFWVHASFEPLVMLCGLAFVLLFPLAASAKGMGWRLALGILAFVGVWLDWSTAFFFVATWPWLLERGPQRRRIITLAWCLLATVLALAAFYWWAQWAEAGPLAPRIKGFEPFFDRAKEHLGPPQDFLRWANQLAERYRVAHGLPALGLGLVGFLGLWRLRPRLAAGLLTACFLQGFVPADHARSILHFTSFAAIPLALGAGVWVHWTGRIGALLAVGVIAMSAWVTWDHKTAGADSVFRDLGWTIDEAALRYDDAGQVARGYTVHCTVPYAYQSYILSPFVRFRSIQASELDTLFPHPGPGGLRLLVLEWEVSPRAKNARMPPVDPALVRRLEAGNYPSYEVPRLVRRVRIQDGDIELNIRRARVFTLVP